MQYATFSPSFISHSSSPPIAHRYSAIIHTAAMVVSTLNKLTIILPPFLSVLMAWFERSSEVSHLYKHQIF